MAAFLSALDSRLKAELEPLFSNPPAASHFRVAYSGGRDSLAVLLLARDFLSPERISALHIHHGLHAAADDWATLCRANCDQLGVPCEQVCVQVSAIAELGPEAAARNARYQAFSASLERGHCLLLAHHLDDQVETVLLRLLRGAGPDGLQAMPGSRPLGKGVLWRPLLGTPGATLRTVAECSGLDWVEDPSNSGCQSDRGYLRSQVMPALAGRWPGFRRTVSRAAQHCRAAVGVRDTLQAPLLAKLRAADGSFDLDALNQFPEALASELLRAWLIGQRLPVPQARTLRNLRNMMRAARSDSAPLATWHGVEIRRFGHRLYAMRPDTEPPCEYSMDWQAAKALALPRTLGQLCLEPLESVPANWCFQVTSRRGGERFKPFEKGPSRRLKHFYQENRVPPWERARIPLLWHAGVLLALGDRWINDEFARRLAAAGLQLRWKR